MYISGTQLFEHDEQDTRQCLIPKGVAKKKKKTADSGVFHLNFYKYLFSAQIKETSFKTVAFMYQWGQASFGSKFVEKKNN